METERPPNRWLRRCKRGKPRRRWRLRYEKVRDLVGDGDVFFFKGQGVWSKAFEFIDGSFYSHAGIAAWWGDRLMILEAVARGIRAVPMSVKVSTYNGPVDWYKLKRNSFDGNQQGNDRPDLQKVILEGKACLGLNYGFLHLAETFFWRWIARVRWWRLIQWAKAKRPTRFSPMFCSQYVESCFHAGHMSLTGVPTLIVFPKDLATATDHLQYMCTIPHDSTLVPARQLDTVPTLVQGRVRRSAEEPTNLRNLCTVPQDLTAAPADDPEEIMSTLRARAREP